MFQTSEANSTIKLIDFGCSILHNNTNISKIHGGGTVYYSPPESKKGVWTDKADTWALGIIMFALLSGKFPFHGQSPTGFYQFIKNYNIQMNGNIYK